MLPDFLYSSIPAVSPSKIPIPAVTASPIGPANFAAPIANLPAPLRSPPAAGKTLDAPLIRPLPARLPSPGSFFSPRTMNEPSAVSPPRIVVPKVTSAAPIAGTNPLTLSRIPLKIPFSLSSPSPSRPSIPSETPSTASTSFSLERLCSRACSTSFAVIFSLSALPVSFSNSSGIYPNILAALRS